MKQLILKLLRAVWPLRLARCQQASENETLDNDQIRLLANREFNLIVLIKNDVKQFNAILEKDNDISFTKTNHHDD